MKRPQAQAETYFSFSDFFEQEVEEEYFSIVEEEKTVKAN